MPRLPGTPHRWQKPGATGLRTRCPHSPGPESAVHQGVTADSSPKYNFRKSRFTLPVVPFYLIFRYEFSTPLYTLLPYKRQRLPDEEALGREVQALVTERNTPKPPSTGASTPMTPEPNCTASIPLIPNMTEY